MTAIGRAFVGVPAATGVAIAPWATIERPPVPEPRRIGPDEVAAELDRIRTAVGAAAGELDSLAGRVRDAGHDAEAAIFAAQSEMARDPALFEGARERMVETGVDAVGAVLAASRSIADMLGGLGDPLLAARATDVLDVGDRIVRQLAGAFRMPTLDAPAIVVADDLSPSLTATLPRDRLVGIVLAGSSPTAHASILARAYGIPAVVGAADAVAAIRATVAGTRVAIDGATGEIVIDPDPTEIGRFEGSLAAVTAERERDRVEATEPVRTTDGVDVTLLANIGGPEEAAGAIALGARGVGLFRTEFLFLERDRPPSEEEQLEAYAAAVTAFRGDPVTIRLLDVGGDKPIPYLDIPPEDNPFLGIRALRLASTHADLFLTQLRACYRAAAVGPVKVMAPMVADARDVSTFLDLAARARAEAEAAGHAVGEPRLGVMFEIPSAILTAPTYLARIDFASLGTNDLLQYTLAVDRGNAALERYRDPLHPALLRLIHSAVVATEGTDVELSVCGEMAGDPIAALALVGLGIRVLSGAPPSLPAVRRAIRGASAEGLRTRARAALDDDGPEAVRRRFD